MRVSVPLQLLSIVLFFGVTLSAQSLPTSARSDISVYLTQTLSNCELASGKPFSLHGVLAIRTDDAIQLWDTRTGTLAATLPVKEKTLKVYFSADGNTLVTSLKENKSIVTKLWDVQSGRLRTVVDGLIVFGPTGTSGSQTLITLDSNQLKFWNAADGTLQKAVAVYRKSFANSVISPDGQLVVKYGGGKAFLWEAETGRLRAELKPPQTRNYIVPWYVDVKVEDALFSPDSKLLATTDLLNSIQLWDTATGQMRALLEGHGSTIYELRFSADGQLLASASRDGTARLWDVSTGTERATLRAGDEIARSVVFNPDATMLAVGYHTQARIWDVPNAQLRATLAKHRDVNTAVIFGTYWDAIGIVLSPGGDLLVSEGDKVVNLWQVDSGQLVQTLEGARPPAVFSPDGKFLVTRGSNHTVLLWRLEKS